MSGFEIEPGLEAARLRGISASPSGESPDAPERYEGQFEFGYWRTETIDLKKEIWEKFLTLNSRKDRAEFLTQLIHFLANTLAEELAIGERTASVITIKAIKRGRGVRKTKKTTVIIRARMTGLEVRFHDVE